MDDWLVGDPGTWPRVVADRVCRLWRRSLVDAIGEARERRVMPEVLAVPIEIVRMIERASNDHIAMDGLYGLRLVVDRELSLSRDRGLLDVRSMIFGSSEYSGVVERRLIAEMVPVRLAYEFRVLGRFEERLRLSFDEVYHATAYEDRRRRIDGDFQFPAYDGDARRSPVAPSGTHARRERSSRWRRLTRPRIAWFT